MARERRELLEMDAHLLKDIGISRVDALREAAHSNWDDPLALPRDRPRPQLHGWLPGREG